MSPLGTCALDFEARSRDMPQEPFGHLASRGVVRADEENALFPVSVFVQIGSSGQLAKERSAGRRETEVNVPALLGVAGSRRMEVDTPM